MLTNIYILVELVCTTFLHLVLAFRNRGDLLMFSGFNSFLEVEVGGKLVEVGGKLVEVGGKLVEVGGKLVVLGANPHPYLPHVVFRSCSRS